jgi:hypothetical protein
MPAIRAGQYSDRDTVDNRSAAGGLTWPAFGILHLHRMKDAPYQPNKPKLSALISEAKASI